MEIWIWISGELGLHNSLDVLQSWADPGSCSPSAYVKIFDGHDKCRKIECSESSGWWFLSFICSSYFPCSPIPDCSIPQFMDPCPWLFKYGKRLVSNLLLFVQWAGTGLPTLSTSVHPPDRCKVWKYIFYILLGDTNDCPYYFWGYPMDGSVSSGWSIGYLPLWRKSFCNANNL